QRKLLASVKAKKEFQICCFSDNRYENYCYVTLVRFEILFSQILANGFLFDHCVNILATKSLVVEQSV
ncbi:MAG: hypothetical protein AAF990_25560, partial [Bacteroidota bacterium]